MALFHSIKRLSGAAVYMGGKAKSTIHFYRCLPKVATEVAYWTDSGRLFQRDGAQDINALAPVLVLILGTNRVIPLFDLSEHDGRDVASMELR